MVMNCYVRGCHRDGIQTLSLLEDVYRFSFCDTHLDAATNILREYDTLALQLRDKLKHLRNETADI